MNTAFIVFMKVSSLSRGAIVELKSDSGWPNTTLNFPISVDVQVHTAVHILQMMFPRIVIRQEGINLKKAVITKSNTT